MRAATSDEVAGRPRFALVGCGDFGKQLAGYAVEQAELAALCDPDAGNLAATGAAMGVEVPGYGDYRELLRRERLDAVLVTAANHVHAEITVAAAEAGVHVFCEKAMARTARECWDMVAACRRHGVKLMVGHKRRLRPPWARMVELTADGLLGAPLSITVAQYTDNRPYEFFDTWWSDPARGGGFFHMHGVHVIDWFRAMCGDARDVHAVYGPQHDSRYGFRDIVHATYRFHSGAVATIAGGLSFPLHQFRESQGPWGECRHGASSWCRPSITSTCTGSASTLRPRSTSGSTTWASTTRTGARSATSFAGSARVPSRASRGWRACAAWR